MITIYVVDTSAQERSKMAEFITALTSSGDSNHSVLPLVDVRPVSIQELRYQEAPNLCIVGASVIENDITQVGLVKELLGSTPLFALLRSDRSNFGILDQLARFGVVDTINEKVTPNELVSKLIFIGRRQEEAKPGKLVVVDGGAGGVGVTSVAAALGESFAVRGQTTCLYDLDFEGQALSRFLKAKPFVNENLHHLFTGDRPISKEFVEQAVAKPFSDIPLECVTPLPDSDDIYDPSQHFDRSLISVLEALDTMYDMVIVDAARVRGALKQTLYRVADRVLYVLNSDPSTLFASVDRLAKCSRWLSPEASIVLCENRSAVPGLSQKVLRSELISAVVHDRVSWSSQVIPFCKAASRWPASGGTLMSMGKAPVKDVFLELPIELGLMERSKADAGRITVLFSHVTGAGEALSRGARSLRLPSKANTPLLGLDPTFKTNLPNLSEDYSSGVITVQPAERESLNEEREEINLDSLISSAVVSST